MSELKVDKVSPRSGNYVALNTVGSKNIIINGDMSIAQRGTSATSLGTGTNSVYLIDRFKFIYAGAPTGRFTMTQDTDVPSGQGFYNSLKLDCTTAQGSLASGDAFYLATEFEGQNLQYLKKGTASAESLTLSFWVKAVKTGNYVVDLYDGDNTRIIGNTYTINSASTWEKKTITFAGDTTGALDNDNLSSLRIWFVLSAGSSFTGTDNTSWGSYSTGKFGYNQTVNFADDTANNFWITGVQLEAGTTASDFEFLPHDVNLTRCERYCFSKIGSECSNGQGMLGAAGNARSSTQAFPQYIFPTKMRTAPSLTVNNATGFLLYQTSAIQCTAVSIDISDPYACSMVATVASGLTSPTFYTFGCNSATSQLIFSAEL